MSKSILNTSFLTASLLKPNLCQKSSRIRFKPYLPANYANIFGKHWTPTRNLVFEIDFNQGVLVKANYYPSVVQFEYHVFLMYIKIAGVLFLQSYYFCTQYSSRMSPVLCNEISGQCTVVKNHTKNPTQNSTFFHKTLWIISMDTGEKVCLFE